MAAERWAAAPIDFRMGRRMMADRKTKGSISGDAQTILDAIDELHLPESFKLLVRKIRQSTYYKAGFHVDDGIEGIEEHSCFFSLAAWAKELGMSRQQLYNLRTDLIEHGAITYAPIPSDPHYGIVAWNLNVSEWIPFKKGGARLGAGRPKKNQSVYENNLSVYDSDNQSVYEKYSNGVQSDFNRCTGDGNEASVGQAAPPPLRNVSKKQQETKRDANASCRSAVALATPTHAPPVMKKSQQSRKASDMPPEDDPAYKVAVYFRKSILTYAPNARLPDETPGAMRAWVHDIRTMLGTHKRAPPDIKLVIDFIARTEFWQPNVLSARKLKDKFDTLLLQAKREGKANGQHTRVSQTAASERADSPAITARREELRRQKQQDRRGNGDDPPAA